MCPPRDTRMATRRNWGDSPNISGEFTPNDFGNNASHADLRRPPTPRHGAALSRDWSRKAAIRSRSARRERTARRVRCFRCGRPAKMWPSSPITDFMPCSTGAGGGGHRCSRRVTGAGVPMTWVWSARCSMSRHSPRWKAMSPSVTAATPPPDRPPGKTRSRYSVIPRQAPELPGPQRKSGQHRQPGHASP